MLSSPLLALAALLAGSPPNLLDGRAPSASTGVIRPEAVSDGLAAPDGDGWNTDRAAILGGAVASVVFDLGQSRQLRSAWLQADANDHYLLAVSQNGADFLPLWTAPPAGSSGMQPRWTVGLDTPARYLRVSASGGDGSYSLSELQVFDEVPADFPPEVRRAIGLPTDERARSALLLFGLAVLAFTLLSVEGRPRWALGLLVLPGVAGYQLLDALGSTPLGPREVSLARGVIALVAGLIVLWAAFAPERLAPDRRVVLATLGACGVAGVLAFYNLGRPQFRDDKSQQSTFVHLWDLRQYYATAKYFPELGFWRMYEADVAAYAEDRGATLAQLSALSLRDLRTNRGTTVAEIHDRVAEVKGQFTPERWEEYRRDARFFREAMGEGSWRSSMFDLGANATPFWITVARLLFGALPLSLDSLLRLAMLDVLLLAAMFLAIGFTFGPRTMFVCMAIFGANDFIMFGSNWAGAVLRHDWLALLGLGACALRAKRWGLAGVLLGLATSIRAFPAFAVIGLCLPAVWSVAERALRTRRFPRPAEVFRDERPTVLAGLAAVGTVAVLVLLTSAALSPAAWPEWLQKVGLLSAEVHANPVSLKSIIVGSDASKYRLQVVRLPLYLPAMIGFAALVLVAARKKRPEQAAMLGLILLPVLMVPANYYLHLVCLLPMIGIERSWKANGPPIDGTDAWGWTAVLLLCAAQYFTNLPLEIHLHFYLSSVLLMVGLTVLLVSIVWRDGAEVVELLPRSLGPWSGARKEREPAPSDQLRSAR